MQSSQAALLLEKSWLCSGFGALALSSKARGSSMSCRRAGRGRCRGRSGAARRGGPGPRAGHSPRAAPPRQLGQRAWTHGRGCLPERTRHFLGSHLVPNSPESARRSWFALPKPPVGGAVPTGLYLPTCKMGLLHRGPVLVQSQGALHSDMSAKHFSARKCGAV